MGVYIRGIGAISIQQPLSETAVWEPVAYHAPQLRCIEPDYRNYFDPISARRMSRIVKRAVVTSTRALEESGISMPDAVISGTGLGCVEDTEKFLTAMVRNGEECLQPSFFIQSTHNTISSQIAIRLKCHGYNNTHVQRGISFESALQEALLLFACGRIRSALVGGYDELTPTYFGMLGRLGYWREKIDDTLRIAEYPAKGTFAGEGSICFMLSSEFDPSAYAQLEGCEIAYECGDLRGETERFLEKHGISLNEVDVVMTGRNGDERNDEAYNRSWLTEKKEVWYKPACGEFFTAPAYGMFEAAVCLRRGYVPACLTRNKERIDGVRRILILNHWQQKDYSFIVLTSCGN